MKKALIILTMAVCLCGTAWATTIVQTKNFNGIPAMAGSSTFDQFDDNGGMYTLNSIQVSLYLQIVGGELILDNDGELAASGTLQFGAKGTLISTDVSLLDSTPTPIPGEATAFNSQAFNLDPNTGD